MNGRRALLSVRLLYPFAAVLEREGVSRRELLEAAGLPRALLEDLFSDRRVFSLEPHGNDMFLCYEPRGTRPRAIVEFVLGSLVLARPAG